MQQQLKWLKAHDAELIGQLGQLVAIPSISTDGEHQKEIDHSAELTCTLMRQAGLHDVQMLRAGDSNPYAYGEWLGAPASRPSSCTPITMCSRSTSARTGSPTRGR